MPTLAKERGGKENDKTDDWCVGVLRVTSANLSGRRPATDAPAALAEVGLSADVVVDDGVSPGGVPSTVVKVDEDGSRTVLRQGAVDVA